MTITPLTTPHEPTLYEITEPDAMHPHVGWYFETEQGYVRGVFETESAAFMAASKEIEL